MIEVLLKLYYSAFHKHFPISQRTSGTPGYKDCKRPCYKEATPNTVSFCYRTFPLTHIYLNTSIDTPFQLLRHIYRFLHPWHLTRQGHPPKYVHRHRVFDMVGRRIWYGWGPFVRQYHCVSPLHWSWRGIIRSSCNFSLFAVVSSVIPWCTGTSRSHLLMIEGTRRMKLRKGLLFSLVLASPQVCSFYLLLES